MMLGLEDLKESRTCNCAELWHKVVVVLAAVESGAVVVVVVGVVPAAGVVVFVGIASGLSQLWVLRGQCGYCGCGGCSSC